MTQKRRICQKNESLCVESIWLAPEWIFQVEEFVILVANDIYFNEELFLRYEFIESKHISY